MSSEEASRRSAGEDGPPPAGPQAMVHGRSAGDCPLAGRSRPYQLSTSCSAPFDFSCPTDSYLHYNSDEAETKTSYNSNSHRGRTDGRTDRLLCEKYTPFDLTAALNDGCANVGDRHTRYRGYQEPGESIRQSPGTQDHQSIMADVHRHLK